MRGDDVTTFARIENNTAVEVGVQDQPPIEAGWVEVPDEVCVDWTTDGKTWRPPPDPPSNNVGVDISSEQFSAAVLTLQTALDPNTPNPSLADQVAAQSVVVAAMLDSGPLPALTPS